MQPATTQHPTATTHPTKHPVLLGQAGRDSLINFEFVLEAPWKACRLCGALYQSDDDRFCYQLQQDGLIEQAFIVEKGARDRRERWLDIHNRRYHPNLEHEVYLLTISGLPYTPEAAQRLSTYGIIYMGEIPASHEDEISQALLEAPRAPVEDAEGTY